MAFQTLSSLSEGELVSFGLKRTEASKLLSDIERIISVVDVQTVSDVPKVWRCLTEVLVPEFPFELHKMIFDATYEDWDSAKLGPPPAWIPTMETMKETNLYKFMEGMEELKMLDISALHELSVKSPEVFWSRVFDQLSVKFHSPPTCILKDSKERPEDVVWLPGARLNIAEAALSGWDLDLPAIVWADESLPDKIETLSRRDICFRVQHVANALKAWGLEAGDPVAIDMAMSVESVVAYLGVVLSGCTAVSIADSFSSAEIATRLDISKSKAIFTQDFILRGGKRHPLYNRIKEAAAPRAIVFISTSPNENFDKDGCLRPDDITWNDFFSLVPEPQPRSLEEILDPCVCDAYDISAILFSSGTTGAPKAIPWTHVTPLRCASNSFFHQDLRRGDVFVWPTSMGWMMGPWLVYAALFNGAAVGLYTGSPLDRKFGEFVEAANTNVLGLVPSIARSWRGTGCMNGLNWKKSVRCFTSTGEASSPEDYLWLMSCGGYCPIIEYCGGTEIGGAFISGSMIQPQSPGTFTTPVMGTQPVILVDNTDSQEVLENSSSGMWTAIDIEPCSRLERKLNIPPGGIMGELALRVPMFGSSQRLLNADHHSIYFHGMPNGLRRHGDMMQILPGGFCRAAGRCDDTFNIGGIKVSSVEIETAILEGLSEVKEAAAIAVTPKGGGPNELIAILVLHSRVLPESDIDQLLSDLKKACQRVISSRLNPLFRISKVEIASSLPRNASNKVMRRVLRQKFI